MYVSIVSEYVQSTAAASAGRRPGEGGRAQSYGGAGGDHTGEGGVV